MPSSETIQPFTIDISQEEIDRLHQKIENTRNPTKDVVPETGEAYGVPTTWMLNLLSHWQNKFNWSNSRAAIDSYSHYKTQIEAINVHFVHQRSPNPNAIPILLIHGWPGSFHEFSELIPLLCNPRDSKAQAFHCIVPSLPGFCFSPLPPRKGWTVKDTARVFHSLMLRLGYTEYAVQAGDWGQFVARELGANPTYSKACKVIHLNYCPGALPSDLTDSDLSARERQCRDRGVDWRTNHVGYAVLMRTRPQSLGWMLEDNPIALLAFIGEKFHEASAPTVHNDPKWLDHILTTVCLYYFTNCITTSALIYYENVPHHQFAEYAIREENLINCPFGYSSYAYDTAPNSKRAVERTGKLVFYKERDYAGHFAALEDPKGVAEDVRQVVADNWHA
jgi:pimeloyl-ACP methyl ester carboxylesterase